MADETKTQDTRKGIIRWWVRSFFGVAIIPVTLHWPAADWGWLWAWALVAVYAVWVLATAGVAYATRPDLLAERASRPENVKSWDVRLMSIVGLLELARNIVAGFDHRFGWTATEFPLWVPVACLIISVLGYGITVWAMGVNAYFSQMVRIQDDRGHQVATGGPYRLVRHPGYTGTIAYHLAAPLMLGSWWAFAIGVVMAALMVVRTALEDRTLQAELPGYDNFARQTRYRLVPGIW